MNKQGQSYSLFLGIIVALLIFFVGVISLDFVKGVIDVARIDSSCTSPASDGGKLLCLVIDGVIPYIIVTFISLAGGMVTSKFL